MQKAWENAVVTQIGVAIYVAPDTSKITHHNRPFHGLVINDSTADKIIRFSDGTVLHAGPLEVHYFPKGATYSVEILSPGGCWAINFDLYEPIAQKPFAMKLRNSEGILKEFREAVTAWRERNNLAIRKCLYGVILKLQKEQEKTYIPSEKERLIQPAVDRIHRDFANHELSVQELALLCGVSEAYFRRIFMEKFMVSPKAYIIRLRMEHAGRLLESGHFSVSSVAQLCGYFEPCHFSREFKRYYDLSPAEYAHARAPQNLSGKP